MSYYDEAMEMLEIYGCDCDNEDYDDHTDNLCLPFVCERALRVEREENIKLREELERHKKAINATYSALWHARGLYNEDRLAIHEALKNAKPKDKD